MENAFGDAGDILLPTVRAVILVNVIKLVSKLFHMSEPATIGAPRTKKFDVKLAEGDNPCGMSLVLSK